MRGKGIFVFIFVLALALAGLAAPRAQAATFKPYILASDAPGALASQAVQVKQKLTAAGFALAGEYTPYAGALVIAVTSPELQKVAAATEFGGYGAVMRVALTQVGPKVQLSYTNPPYWANLYRLKSDLAPVAAKLAAALGSQKQFGAEDGFTPADLREYHYMIGMPYFEDQDLVNEYGSHQEAVAAVSAGLAKGAGDTAQVYAVSVAGSDQMLFGVALKSGPGSDQRVMRICDEDSKLKHTAYMPYEILVTGKKAYALPAKFRIAISFPDLGMITFMKISDAPDAILESLRMAAAGN